VRYSAHEKLNVTYPSGRRWRPARWSPRPIPCAITTCPRTGCSPIRGAYGGRSTTPRAGCRAWSSAPREWDSRGTKRRRGRASNGPPPRYGCRVGAWFLPLCPGPADVGAVVEQSPGCLGTRIAQARRRRRCHRSTGRRIHRAPSHVSSSASFCARTAAISSHSWRGRRGRRVMRWKRSCGACIGRSSGLSDPSHVTALTRARAAGPRWPAPSPIKARTDRP